jgi:hypothetical protein
VEEGHPRFDDGRQASREGLGGSEDLFVSAAVYGELVPVSARKYCVPGAPVLFGTEKNQLLSAIFAREDDPLLERIPHEFTSSALFSFAFTNYYRARGWPSLLEATSHIRETATRSTKLR